MALARRGRERGVDYWPGFVDALSTLILGIVFLLSVFVIVQFFLSQEVTGKDTALARLNAQLAQLTEMLSLEKVGKANLEDTLASLRSSLALAESERDRLKSQNEGLLSGSGKANEIAGQLENQKSLTSRAMAQVELLNQQIAALRRQLSALESALEASESKDKESQARIADLGQRLNLALAQRVQELSRFRSEFFGRLRTILGDRPDIRVVGDRFVFQSEVLFPSASADIEPSGQDELRKLADSLRQISSEIPSDLPWVLQINGHTDTRPISTPEFPSNWELSTERAINVGKFLISQGIPPERIAVAGFASFQPLDDRHDEIAYRRNRRIELKLTTP
jgi:chemotaxis protein MotB